MLGTPTSSQKGKKPSRGWGGGQNASLPSTHKQGTAEEAEDQEFPLGLSRLGTRLVTMRTQIQSLVPLSGLRIWLCHGLLCRLQMWLGSQVAVAVV